MSIPFIKKRRDDVNRAINLYEKGMLVKRISKEVNICELTLYKYLKLGGKRASKVVFNAKAESLEKIFTYSSFRQYSENPLDILEHKEEEEIIKNFYRKRVGFVLHLRYLGYTLQQIGDFLKITRERVRQLEVRGRRVARNRDKGRYFIDGVIEKEKKLCGNK